MGLLRYISNMRSIKREMERIERYLHMTKEELGSLPDEELMDALSTILLNREGEMDVEECLQEFCGAVKISYIVNYFDMEVQNGGLCQYFVNSSRMTAPYILECMDVIGAVCYKDLLEKFISENDISLDDLDSFITEDIKDYQKQVKRYPFDDFDDAYYELYEDDPLEQYLLEYVRKHLEEFSE